MIFLNAFASNSALFLFCCTILLNCAFEERIFMHFIRKKRFFIKRHTVNGTQSITRICWVRLMQRKNSQLWSAQCANLLFGCVLRHFAFINAIILAVTLTMECNVMFCIHFLYILRMQFRVYGLKVRSIRSAVIVLCSSRFSLSIVLSAFNLK